MTIECPATLLNNLTETERAYLNDRFNLIEIGLSQSAHPREWQSAVDALAELQEIVREVTAE